MSELYATFITILNNIKPSTKHEFIFAFYPPEYGSKMFFMCFISMQRDVGHDENLRHSCH